MKSDNRAIGIFDSGIGGLTVLKECRKLLPDEQLIYFGDTARIPYGGKSRELVRQYALEDAAFLLQYGVKMIVVACNTASALALDILKERLNIPVIGVVIPGAIAATNQTRNGKIGIIGTLATIGSMAYPESIKSENKRKVDVYSRACPLLVPLVEAGWLDGQITELTIEKYLADLLAEKIDTLVLGCTHYPLLKRAIQKVIGEQIVLIDSGKETARIVKETLQLSEMLNLENREEDRFFLSDIPQKFEEIGSRFLGGPLMNVQRVDFESFLIKSRINL